ncbi:MAG: hypothetical protein AAF789_13010, partial [Bacteroidota bacterium]
SILLLLIWFVTLEACVQDDGIPNFDIEEIEGVVPLYETDLIILQEQPKPLSNPGKILSIGDLLLINDINNGIHVIDNTNPQIPEKRYFINIPFNKDLNVKNDLLYADNGPDLVVLRIGQTGFDEVSRLENVFFDVADFQDFPPQSNVYFKCPEEERGQVIGWVNSIIERPDCYKN